MAFSAQGPLVTLYPARSFGVSMRILDARVSGRLQIIHQWRFQGWMKELLKLAIEYEKHKARALK